MIRLAFLILCSAAYVAGAITESKLRITSDERVQPGEAPYQVSLQIYDQHICGGSLIGPRHVLTAAHCIYDFTQRKASKSTLKVAVGTTTVPGGTIHDVDRVAHPKSYNPNTFVADIAIVRLAKPVTESAYVKIIGLPDENQQLTQAQILLATGFGTSQLGGVTSPYLKKLKMIGVNHNTCQQKWSETALIRINSGIICATTPSRNGVCSGDSGGPLVVNKQTVVGVAMAVNPDGCGTDVPDLFTRVSTFLKFIRQEMKRLN